MSAYILEIAAFTPRAALVAVQAGADRIELCSGYAEGGLSPSVGTVAYVREHVAVRLHTMVRPRVGDFVYDELEITCMLREIALYKSLGVDGVVVGALCADATVNAEALRRMVQAARPMSVTFHRAFDQCADQELALEQLIACGVDRVLTSGGCSNTAEGLEQLEKLLKQAAGRIIVLPGGGIGSHNARQIADRLGVVELHLSGKAWHQSAMTVRTEKVSLCAPGEVFDWQWYECDAQKIEAVRVALSCHEKKQHTDE